MVWEWVGEGAMASFTLLSGDDTIAESSQGKSHRLHLPAPACCSLVKPATDHCFSCEHTLHRLLTHSSILSLPSAGPTEADCHHRTVIRFWSGRCVRSLYGFPHNDIRRKIEFAFVKQRPWISTGSTATLHFFHIYVFFFCFFSKLNFIPTGLIHGDTLHGQLISDGICSLRQVGIRNHSIQSMLQGIWVAGLLWTLWYIVMFVQSAPVGAVHYSKCVQYCSFKKCGFMQTTGLLLLSWNTLSSANQHVPYHTCHFLQYVTGMHQQNS